MNFTGDVLGRDSMTQNVFHSSVPLYRDTIGVSSCKYACVIYLVDGPGGGGRGKGQDPVSCHY